MSTPRNPHRDLHPCSRHCPARAAASVIFAIGLAFLAIPEAVGAVATRTARSEASPRLGLPYSHLRKVKIPGGTDELWAGALTVFENRRTRTGRTIDLNILVLPALDQTDKEEPLFELAGGPGVAATRATRDYLTVVKEYRRHRDVVLVDQRGTGKSNPLTAPHGQSPQSFLSELYPVDHVTALRRTLEQRADLTQYTTAIAMDDLDDVRAWLGYEQISLFGISYGARAALVYMRQHPEHVRCAILMGVAPTDMEIPLYHARDAERAMNLLLDECARDRAGRKAFPELRREWADLLARLEKNPARVRYVSEDGKADGEVEIKRDIFAEKIRELLYGAVSARKIPLIVHQAARGNFVPFLSEAIPANRSAPDVIAAGTYLSVTTAEDTSFIDPVEAAKMNVGKMFGNYRVEQQTRAAHLWPRAEIPESYRQPVSSDIPVLILSGYNDPVTPPEWAEHVVQHLPNGRHVIIPHGTHDPFGLSHQEILDRLIMEFLATKKVRSLDVSGLEKMRPPPFVTR